MTDDDTAAQARELTGEGLHRHHPLETEDRRASHKEMTARGVAFAERPEGRPYGIDPTFRDPSGSHIRLTQVMMC